MAGLKDTIATMRRMRGQTTIAFPVMDRGVLTKVAAFGRNPGNLTMLNYRPQNLGAGRPLVVVLHGCTQTAEGYAVAAGWVDLSDRYGFGLLCPEQDAANNPNRCFNWFNPDDVKRESGEVASIRAMIDRAVSQMSSDPAQIYVTGLSAGGAMTAAMLATYPEVFAGGGIVAGLPYGVAKDVGTALAAMQQGPAISRAELGRLARSGYRSGAWPRVSVWHGTADATVRAANADASVSQWLELYGLSGEADDITVDGLDRADRWLSDGAVVVERRLITGLGHGTPIASEGPEAAGRAAPFILNVEISSSIELLPPSHYACDSLDQGSPEKTNRSQSLRRDLSSQPR